MRLLPRLAVLFAGAAAVAGAGQAAAAVHRFHADHVLGTSLDVAVTGATPAQAALAAQAARAEIDRLDALLSRWRPEAELARVNAGDVARAPELLQVADLADAWRARTGGAYDGRLGALTAARRSGDGAALRRALASLAQAPGPALDAQGRVAAGVALDFDGVAKGYVLDAALAAARRAAPQARGLLLDLGGDVRADGRGPQGGWRIGLGEAGGEAARAHVRLPPGGGALAFSGAGARDLPDGGSHLLAARDGESAPAHVRAAVLAPCAADADALATALCLMPAAEGLALAERWPGVEAELVDAAGAVRATSGWRARVAPEPRLIRAAAPAGWPAGQVVTVSYDVPRIAAPKYYAPYIAIWVTDADRNLVRTLAVLGEKPRYLESNYVWWRRYGRRTPNIDALARPTRAPGRYTATWDGATDAGGQAAPGRYLVHVEAARQDGGHTYETLEITVGPGGASAAAAPPKDELGALRATVGPAGRRA